MPRTVLEPRFHVEYLSILDSEGNLDTALEPKLSPDELKSLYRAMVLGRRLDERMVRLQRQGRIGTFAPIKGQEASQLGSTFTLRPSDWMVPSFRETAAMVWRGWPIEKLLLFFAGYLEGGQPAPRQHDLPITIPVATQLPHAVGLTYAAQYRGDDAVVMVFFGDGAPSHGDLPDAPHVPRGGAPRAGAHHLPARRAHDGRRPDEVPVRGRGGGVGAEGPAHALPRLPRGARPARGGGRGGARGGGGAGGGGGRGGG